MTFIENTPSASAPDIEGGLVPAKFLGLAKVAHPDWADPKGKFGPDNGDRLHWRFALLDDDGDALYDEGDPIEIEATNSTNFNTKSDKSKNAAWLKSISPSAFAKVDAGIPVDPAELEGALCMLLLEIKDNGWPKIVNVLPAAKKRKAKPAPVVVADDEDEDEE